jgi:glutamine amidotransferase
MQLMTRRSDEGSLPGLGWITTETTAFSRDPASSGLRIPHMGWSAVTAADGNPLLASGAPHRFYFVHSFRVVDPGDAHAIATCRYGGRFVAAFQKGNLFGVQFHPEKSHSHGMRLLTAFSALGRS